MRCSLLFVILTACGGALNDGGDGGDGGTEASSTDAQPTTTSTFAIHDLFLGESLNGVPSVTAWKSFGRNVDGLVTDKTSTNVCTLTSTSLAYQTDGNNGIDNNWGSVLLPIIQTAASLQAPSITTSTNIQQGASTLLITIGSASQAFAGAVYPGAPAFDATTVWPVLASSVNDGKTIASGAKAQFTGSSIASAPLEIGISIGTQPLVLTIHAPVITFTQSGSDLTNGMISGVLETEKFIADLKVLAGTISQSLCGAAFDGIADQIRQAQDILLDGTNAPNTPCNAISIGIGFTAKLVANATTVVSDPPTTDPCN